MTVRLTSLRDLGAALGVSEERTEPTVETQIEPRRKSADELWAECKRARDACDRELESTLWRQFIRAAEEEQRAKGVIG